MDMPYMDLHKPHTVVDELFELLSSVHFLWQMNFLNSSVVRAAQYWLHIDIEEIHW